MKITLTAAALAVLAFAAAPAGAQTGSSGGTTAASASQPAANPARRSAGRAAPQPGRTERTPTNAETTAGVAAAEDDDDEPDTRPRLTTGLNGSEATQGRGGEWGVAPGSGRLGEPGAISMGIGSTGGDSLGSTSPGQSASSMVRTVTPPGSPPPR
ncbi:hypothetical protein [Phenylobacterium deserti]|uniref:Uncharacterized protein n=1 Tax=Phenylobacterium deserti TaxID=1914756 RepID=A0A328AD04_9CAUL|nr:hypothetical protein [Phenylobacterium deserti]RAK52475.1 hypothetical protein DJ018_09680 [Phenylobacterium deserti]